VVDPGDHLDEGRLAGPVVADQCDNLAQEDFEVDAVEGLDGSEALGDVLELEDRGSRRDYHCLPPLRMKVRRAATAARRLTELVEL